MDNKVHESAMAASRRVAEKKIERVLEAKRTRQKVQLEKIQAVKRDRVILSKKARALSERVRLKSKKRG